MKLDNEPRLSAGPSLYQSLIEWARRVVLAVNENTDKLSAQEAAIADLTARIEALEP